MLLQIIWYQIQFIKANSKEENLSEKSKPIVDGNLKIPNEISPIQFRSCEYKYNLDIHAEEGGRVNYKNVLTTCLRGALSENSAL